MLSLSQRLSQQQKLSPQQIQYQKLLQLNTMALEQRIKTELELNPILEEDLELKQEEKEPDEAGEEIEDSDFSEEDEFSVEDFMNDEDYLDDPSYNNNSQADLEKFQPTAPQRESLQEYLLNQFYLLNLDEPLVLLGEEIIGNLDQDGYLKQGLDTIVSNLEMFDHVKLTLEDAENVLKEIQVLDPIGIASRSLQECLLIQLQYGTFDPYYSYLAEEMLKNHFDDFVQKRFDSTMQKMSLSSETLRAILDLIQKLNPKPGEGNFEVAELNQITPDFLLEKVDNNYVITLNDRAMPSVTVNAAYIEMLNANKGKKKISDREKNTYKFLREKFESAKWFIACIEQRRETLLKVMRAILEKQVAFFEKGPKFLRPMIYKDIAEEIMMDISTISRVVNGKFVQSMQGVHELKYFFSEGLATDSGEEVSNKHIKERIKEIIITEDKQSPLSDDKIADILNEEGIHIARRTVAKYREQLRLPVARLRKTL